MRSQWVHKTEYRRVSNELHKALKKIELLEHLGREMAEDYADLNQSNTNSIMALLKAGLLLPPRRISRC